MIRRRAQPGPRADTDSRILDELHEWVLSLPWVVERSFSLGTPGVRAFAADCGVLGIRRLWMITGLELGPSRRERRSHPSAGRGGGPRGDWMGSTTHSDAG